MYVSIQAYMAFANSQLKGVDKDQNRLLLQKTEVRTLIHDQWLFLSTQNRYQMGGRGSWVWKKERQLILWCWNVACHDRPSLEFNQDPYLTDFWCTVICGGCLQRSEQSWRDLSLSPIRWLSSWTKEYQAGCWANLACRAAQRCQPYYGPRSSILTCSRVVTLRATRKKKPRQKTANESETYAQQCFRPKTKVHIFFENEKKENAETRLQYPPV